MLSSELERIFDASVPEVFQKSTLHLLCQVYPQSLRDVKAKFQWPETAYMWGHERHCQFNRDWRLLASSMNNPNVSASVHPNAAGNYQYTLIQCGRLLLTVSLVDDNADSVRESLFRNSLIYDSQPSLFEDTEEKLSNDSRIYATLIHAPSRTKEGGLKAKPSMAKFIFPMPRGKRHELHIDLFARFGLTVPTDKYAEEQIPDVAHPEMKRLDDDQKGQASA